jgi:hypothetical protein
MMHQSRFLTAEWNNLLLLNYAVDPCLLERFVPAGTELDGEKGTGGELIRVDTTNGRE